MRRLDDLRTRNSAAYKGLYALLMRDGAEDFCTGGPAMDSAYFDENIDIHHIFPKVLVRRVGHSQARLRQRDQQDAPVVQDQPQDWRTRAQQLPVPPAARDWDC